MRGRNSIILLSLSSFIHIFLPSSRLGMGAVIHKIHTKGHQSFDDASRQDKTNACVTQQSYAAHESPQCCGLNFDLSNTYPQFSASAFHIIFAKLWHVADVAFLHLVATLVKGSRKIGTPTGD